MKKRLLFVMTTLRSGGIATSLCNLLEELDKDERISADLLLFHSDANDVKNLPSSVNVMTANSLANIIAISQKETWKKGAHLWLTRYVLGGFTKVFGHTLPYKLIFASNRKHAGYDWAISCTQSAPPNSLYGGCNEFVLQNVFSKRKAAFIHCDYVAYGLNNHRNHNIYKRFDRLALVSKSVRDIFLSAEPEMDDKTFVVRNCQNHKKIFALANKEPVSYGRDAINIVTVARLSEEKGHFRALEALAALKKEKHSFRWHIVGGGARSFEDKMKARIHALDLEGYVQLHGNQSNPYLYMVNADLLLVPSFHEAAPMVFGEAHLLGLPILTTKTISAVEMVGDTGIGFVCQNSTEGLINGIREILENRMNLNIIKEQQSLTRRFDNELPLKDFYRLID